MEQKHIDSLIRRFERTGEVCARQAKELARIAKRLDGTPHRQALETMASAFEEEANAIRNHLRIVRGEFGELQFRETVKKQR